MTREQLKRLWDVHYATPFPSELYGEPAGVDVVTLDSAIAGCVSSALAGATSAEWQEIVRSSTTALKLVQPLLRSRQAVEYCERLIAMGEVTIALGGN